MKELHPEERTDPEIWRSSRGKEHGGEMMNPLEHEDWAWAADEVGPAHKL
jgi:hypothetical protein